MTVRRNSSFAANFANLQHKRSFRRSKPKNMLDSLPTDAVCRVATFLDLSDALSLTHTCTAFHLLDVWRAKYYDLPVRAAMRPADDTLEAWGRAFVAAARGLNGAPSAAMSITWAQPGSRWWEQGVYEPSSPFGRAAVLHSVCWLDIQGSIFAPKGSFDVLLRVFVRNFGGLWSRSLSVAPASEAATGGGSGSAAAAASAKPDVLIEPAAGDVADTRSQFAQGDWNWCHLGRVHVRSAGGATIRFHVHDHSNEWKSGLKVDRVVLVPIDQTEAVTGVHDIRDRVGGFSCRLGPGPRVYRYLPPPPPPAPAPPAPELAPSTGAAVFAVPRRIPFVVMVRPVQRAPMGGIMGEQRGGIARGGNSSGVGAGASSASAAAASSAAAVAAAEEAEEEGKEDDARMDDEEERGGRSDAR